MDINDKKFNRTKRIVYALISIVLAGFLISLSYNIMYDMDEVVTAPRYVDFVGDEVADGFNKQIKALDNESEMLDESKMNVLKLIQTAELNKRHEQESFDNWNKARGTLGTATQDKEVLKRLAKVDEYQKIVQSWQLKYDSISSIQDELYKERQTINIKSEEAKNKATEEYHKVYQQYSLKVFGIRLLFATPILALGIFFFVKKRKNRYSPLYMGFSLFSVYVFFFGLVPYLPSFGGYIRYGVGILLTIGVGYYAIKQLLAYQERRKLELKQSTEERSLKMQSDTASKSFENHVCPSCGKDYLLKVWEVIDSDTPIKITRAVVPSNYCRYCGLQLIKKCQHCHQDNYAHLPFCIKCGDKI